MKQVKENLENSIFKSSQSVQPKPELLTRILSELEGVTKKADGRLFKESRSWSFLTPKIFLPALALIALFLVFGRISPENGFELDVFEAEAQEIGLDIDEAADVIDEEAVLAEVDLYLAEEL